MVLKYMQGFSEGDVSSERNLSIKNVRPAEAIETGLLTMSVATLYRALEDGRFYAVIPTGHKSGREIPVWQFDGCVPEILPRVLLSLRAAGVAEIHAFFVTMEDELNELSPAEVLAGKFFESRQIVEKCQFTFLQQPAYHRQQRVLDLIKSMT